MTEWKDVRFSEVIDLNPRVKLKQGIIYPFIGIADIDESNFYVKEVQTKKFTGQSGSKFHSEDTLFSRITPCLENRKIAQSTLKSKDKGFGSTELLVFRAKEGITDPNYINYLAQTDIIVLPAINSMSGASGRQRADSNYIKKLKIRIPDLNTQNKIANVLSAYDNLIENNNRRIEILEQKAEEIYKEWFVRMRFPGYEKTKFDKGIPEGWEVKKIKDVIDKLESGRRPKNIEVTSSKETVVSLGAGDIKGLGEYSYSNEYLVPLSFYQSLNRGKIKDKDIAIYKDGAYTGKVTMFRDNFPYEKMAINEHVFLVKCKEEIMQNYLLFTLKQSSYYELMQALSMTSAQPGLNQTNFKNIKIQIPNNPLLIMFHEKTEYFLKEIFNLAKQNQTLINQRDLLLPRLMNGTITVK